MEELVNIVYFGGIILILLCAIRKEKWTARGIALRIVIYITATSYWFGYFINNPVFQFLTPFVSTIMLISILITIFPQAVIALVLWTSGILSNTAVMAANGMKMPVLLSPHLKFRLTSRHTLMILKGFDRTYLNFLGDWIPIGSVIMSPGDIFTLVGICITLYYAYPFSAKNK